MKNVFSRNSVQFENILTTIPPKFRTEIYYIRSEQGNISFFDINQKQIFQKCTECFGILSIDFFDIHRKPDPPRLDLEKSILSGRIRTKCRICNGSKISKRKIGGSVVQMNQNEYNELLKTFKQKQFLIEFDNYIKTISIEPPPGEIRFPTKLLTNWKSNLKRNVIKSLRNDRIWEIQIMKIYERKVVEQKILTFINCLNLIKEQRVTSKSRGWLKSFMDTSLYRRDNLLKEQYNEIISIRNNKKIKTLRTLNEKIKNLEDKYELNKILENIPKKTRDLIKIVSPKKVKFYTINNHLVIKKCPGCFEYKEVNDFSLTKNGYSTRCNRCKVILSRKNRSVSEIGSGKRGEIYKGRVIKKYDSLGNIVQRRCTSCDEFKTVKKFIFRKGSSVCEDCFVEIPNNYLTRKGEYFRGEQVRIYDPKTNNIVKKRCSNCKNFKELDEFYFDRSINSSVDKRTSRCKSCCLDMRIKTKVTNKR
ncbi:hypothetical protein [Aquirufa antheringensis]